MQVKTIIQDILHEIDMASAARTKLPERIGFDLVEALDAANPPMPAKRVNHHLYRQKATGKVFSYSWQRSSNSKDYEAFKPMVENDILLFWSMSLKKSRDYLKVYSYRYDRDFLMHPNHVDHKTFMGIYKGYLIGRFHLDSMYNNLVIKQVSDG